MKGEFAMASDAHGIKLDKAYQFRDVESRWYGEWLEKGLFVAETDPDRPCFSMVIPPPNVTGVLHIGHALNNTMQDILARYKRMDGFNTLWVPGTDHAGIATQNVVERQIAAEGLTRDDLGREKFIERVWEWKKNSGGTIIEQLKRLGCSCDWSRERFTMDEGLSRAVREVFVSLYEEGLVYQGDYIINWCPRCHTALADIEVEHEETEGSIWYMRYPVESAEGDAAEYVTVATTRPETMLGDTAVAVNPDDDRYSHLVGKKLILPLMNRPIPVVADEHVDPEFGTGAVKVTPAHDFNDFEIAARHQLESINIFDKNAVLNENAGPYEGLDRFVARKKVLKDLDEQGLLVKEEPHVLAAGGCYRCRTVVEPRISKQWFVKVAPLAERALKAVRDGDTEIVPSSWLKLYEEWMTNIRDWCISRQIWWGHRIPAWTCAACGHTAVSREDVPVCPECGSDRLEQDSDVLDTWFSSALWPFSTLGWPDRTRELELFYPTSVLITSFDILFFWVARMMMMGLHFMDEKPFRYVYLHALVRDAHGKKMSKSTGNVIDPLTIIDKYGTDAVRFTLAAFAAQGRDIKLAEERIEGYRYFVNKIWNAARLVLMHAGGMEDYQERLANLPESLPERWILARTHEVAETVRNALDNFNFDVAAKETYRFFWHEFCDWYLELAKPGLTGRDAAATETARATALYVLNVSLRLLHPFMPFVTEELWHHLPGTDGYIVKARFPGAVPEFADKDAIAEAEAMMEIISGIRNIRSEAGVHPGAVVDVMVIPHSEKASAIFRDCGAYIKQMARVNEITMLSGDAAKPSGALSLILADLEVFVPVEGLVDVEGELARLAREEKKLSKEISRLDGKLSNQGFLSKAPAEVVQKERDRLAEAEARMEKIEAHKKMLMEI
jgi:valyl-tRNA synthetase